jgi:hypothetical protein
MTTAEQRRERNRLHKFCHARSSEARKLSICQTNRSNTASHEATACASAASWRAFARRRLSRHAVRA